MMSISLKMFVIMMVSTFILSSYSPVKFMSSLVVVKLLTFYIMFESSGQSWFSLIMLMIAVGGIMVMMMLMASLLPNSSWSTSKFYLYPFVASMIIWMNGKENNFLLTSQMKMILEYNMNLIALMMLMSFYFLTFNYVVTLSKIPLREIK